MTGSLMYLTSSRPDIVQAVCYCARYQAIPTEKHLKELTAFLDADHARFLDTRKSTFGGIQFLGEKLVSWMSKKQDCTTMSTSEVEYVAFSASCAQVMWMRTQLKDYGFSYNKIPLYYDSQSAIAISSDLFMKALLQDRFEYLFKRLDMRCLTPAELEVLEKETA
ncbi:hypothetical protein Tco_0401481 [Tanacetum coccineum]